MRLTATTGSLADFAIEDHGSIVLVRPLTPGVDVWLEENTRGTWFGNALVVEPRYVAHLVEGLLSEGYVAKYAGHIDRSNDGLGPNITPRSYRGTLVH